MGSVTIAQALGLPFPVLAAGVVAMAVGCFLGAEKLETIFAPKAGKPVPGVATRPSATAPSRRWAPLAVLGLVTVALPARVRRRRRRSPSRRSAPSSSRRRSSPSPQELWILDLRDAKAAPATERIPGTVTLPEGTTRGEVRRDAPRHADARRLRAGRRRRPFPTGLRAFPGEVLVLAGGFDAWKGAVLAAPQPPAEPDPRPHRGVPHEERPERLLHRSRGGPAAEARREGRRDLRRAEEGRRLLTP